MYFGVDYYPEHWEEERWQIDAGLMKELNFNVVRLAEFAWAKIEPTEGKFDFNWLDCAVSILANNGIKTVMCTPTAAPPHWLTTKHPDILPRDEKGILATTGGRRHYCPTNKQYQRHCRNIVLAMVEHFKSSPHIVAWHIDNEFSGKCYCPNCVVEFRNWLKKKYRTLDAINRSWGTIFWSRTFTEWEQIPLADYEARTHSPSARLDFRRFSSDMYFKFQQLQIDIIKEHMPGVHVTTNLMQEFTDIDYYHLSEDLDFVSCDVYPGFGNHPAYAPIVHDTMRGLKNGRPFWVMEQQVGPVNWKEINTLLRPGIVRLWTYQAIAHGAEGVLYFRWRWARFGHEQFHSGILPHSAIPGRAFMEVRELSEELVRVMPEVEKTSVKADIAVILDYEVPWVLQDGWTPHRKLTYTDVINRYYRALFSLDAQVEIVSPKADLSSYKLVIAPMLTITDNETAKNLENYVKEGGYLVMSFFSGILDANATVYEKPFPAPLAEVAGIEVKEFDPLPENHRNSVGITGASLPQGVYTVGTWCDIIETKSAVPVAVYAGDFYKGKPAVTLNKYGKGKALYIGTMGVEPLERDLLKWIAGSAGIGEGIIAADGVEIRPRKGRHGTCLFVMNHNPAPCKLKLPNEYLDLITGKTVCSKTEIPGYGVMILKEEK